MTRLISLRGVFLVLIAAVSASCQKEVNGGQEAAPDEELVAMPLQRPSNFPDIVYDTASNPITKQGFELGRKLFYDGKLSRDNSISCGSCHIQTSAFTQHGHIVSHGIDDLLGTRNSQAVVNLAWSSSFFWDGGVFNLDLQPLAPIQNPVEMGAELPVIIEKLNADSEYPAMFGKVFGSTTISSANLVKALSQFMLQCVSANSRYDKFVRNEGEQLSAEEQEGLSIVRQKCSPCHSTDLFTDDRFHNNGLPPSVVNDKGRATITLNPADEYLFKTPSLRNLTYSAPYMHDGRFRTLEAVLNHYSNGMEDLATLDEQFRQNNTIGIPLSDEEKIKIIAFLKTLDDERFVRDPKLSEQ
ncbi:MAG: cytochrome-c peroxidase [Chitinophagaceae bacterium]|nr:cytochrome-c peroxidase [Chitinophagaceae bacterium]